MVSALSGEGQSNFRFFSAVQGLDSSTGTHSHVVSFRFAPHVGHRPRHDSEQTTRSGRRRISSSRSAGPRSSASPLRERINLSHQLSLFVVAQRLEEKGDIVIHFRFDRGQTAPAFLRDPGIHPPADENSIAHGLRTQIHPQRLLQPDIRAFPERIVG